MTTTGSSLYRPLSTRRAFEEIADQIRDLIYSKKLNPGDKLLVERELSVQFGAGRMAVREALRALEQEGLIYIKHGIGGGAFVKDVDLSVASDSITSVIRRANVRLDDLIAVRIGLERLIVENSIHKITEAELENLWKDIEEMEAVIDSYDKGDELHDPWSMVRIGANFHLDLARATGNPLFEILQESLVKVMRAIMKHRPYDPVFHQHHLALHKAIYEAIKSKDLNHAFDLLTEHSMCIQKGLVDIESEVL